MKFQQPTVGKVLNPTRKRKPTTWHGAKSNSKEKDESNPVIWHDDSRCAFLIDELQ